MTPEVAATPPSPLAAPRRGGEVDRPHADGGDPPSPRPARGRVTLWRFCRLPLLLGLALRLVLAPFTSTPYDVNVWYREAVHGLLGQPLYAQPGFSYPPVWGYLLHALGAVAGLVGLGPTALGHHDMALAGLSAQLPSFTSPVVTTPGFTFALKVVLFAFDLGTGWLLWRLALRLWGRPERARKVFWLWWLSPLVIFESAVHGSFDTMVAFFVLAALVARIEGRLALCGVAVALGVFTKAVPVFVVPLLVVSVFVPLGGERRRSPSRDLGALVAGAVITAVVLTVPSLAAGQLSAMVHQVTNGRAGPAGVGGIGWWGITNAGGLAGLRSFGNAHTSGYGQLASVLDVLTALGVALWWARVGRRRTPESLVLAGAVALAVPVFLQARAQPQYLLWFLPLLCLLGVGSRMSVAGLFVVGVAAVVFEGAVLGPLGFLTPLWWATGWPPVHQVVTSTQSLYSTPGIIGQTESGDGEFLSWLVLNLGLLAVWGGVVAGATARGSISLVRPGPPAESTAPARRSGPPCSPRALGAACLGVAVALILSGLATLGATTAVSVSPTGAGSLSVHVARAPAPLRAAAFSTPEAPVSHVFFYKDDRYPFSGSSAPDLSDLHDDLTADLNRAPTSLPLTTVDASGLASLLRAVGRAPGRAVVIATGTLPTTVWSRTVNLLEPWIRAGGVVLWAGAPPGLFSVVPGTEIFKSPAVVVALRGRSATGPPFGCVVAPTPVKVVRKAVLYPGMTMVAGPATAEVTGVPLAVPDTTPGSGGCVATAATPLARALDIGYLDADDAPTLPQLAAVHGRALGSLARTTAPGASRSSVSWLPHGQGGTVLFGGKVEAPTVSSDMAQLLLSGAARGAAHPSAVTIDPGDTARLPRPGTKAVVVAFDASTEGSFFVRLVPPQR